MNKSAPKANESKPKPLNILFIDNFDSFTYNLSDEFKKLGHSITIYRNTITKKQLEDILKATQPDLIVLSPGPSNPKEAGICLDLIKTYHKKYPIFGICLGHQCLIEALGGVIIKAPTPVHGKKSKITHTNSPMFKDLPTTISAGRYHSLIGKKDTIPNKLQITATAKERDKEIVMAIESRHQETSNSESQGENQKQSQEQNQLFPPLFGIQFHPESILTTQGSTIIKNVLQVVRDAKKVK